MQILYISQKKNLLTDIHDNLRDDGYCLLGFDAVYGYSGFLLQSFRWHMISPPFLILKMEAAGPFEMSVMGQQTTCCYGHEDSSLKVFSCLTKYRNCFGCCQ